ncbi:MAG: rod shape-determining protein MreC, partial [Gammaproteobacteria bacterium]|nr:rod shape-determining protein MreC [Gammaproteobacteria bacterium]
MFAILSVVLLLSTDKMAPYRVYLTTLVSPLQFIASAPLSLLDQSSQYFKLRSTLMSDNAKLKLEHLELSDRLLKLTHLENENRRLNALLGSQVAASGKKLIAKVQMVDSDPFRLQVIINKGAQDGVFVGQPVLDENGMVGQINYVSQFSSTVLLIADNSHAIPLRNNRNDVRLIALGKGDLHQLELQFVTKSTDVKIGDILSTSGLGGRFPQGYPVAKVTAIENRGSQIYSKIKVAPIAQLDRIRYLLLIWPVIPSDTKPGDE